MITSILNVTAVHAALICTSTLQVYQMSMCYIKGNDCSHNLMEGPLVVENTYCTFIQYVIPEGNRWGWQSFKL